MNITFIYKQNTSPHPSNLPKYPKPKPLQSIPMSISPHHVTPSNPQNNPDTKDQVPHYFKKKK